MAQAVTPVRRAPLARTHQTRERRSRALSQPDYVLPTSSVTGVSPDPPPASRRPTRRPHAAHDGLGHDFGRQGSRDGDGHLRFRTPRRDREGFRLESALAMYRLIPTSQLAIVPNAEHFLLWTRPDDVLALLTAFLEAPVPTAK